MHMLAPHIHFRPGIHAALVFWWGANPVLTQGWACMVEAPGARGKNERHLGLNFIVCELHNV